LVSIPAALLTAGATRAAFAPGDAVQLRVRAGGGDLDAWVWQAVYEPFAAVMPLKREPPFTQTLDITFATAGHDWVRSDRVASGATEETWYVGDRPMDEPQTHGGMINWQTSHMRAVLRGESGGAIWAADYDYDGGLEFSGWTVKTPAQAARLIARRLAARYRSKPA
jgi:hypothetical protein